MKKTFTKDLFILWLSLAALVCVALNMYVSRNLLGSEES